MVCQKIIRRPSSESFDQRPSAERIVRHQQQNAKRRQVVWQSGRGFILPTKEATAFFTSPSSRYSKARCLHRSTYFSRGMSIIRERSILSIPKIRYEKSVDEFERLALIRLFESRQTDHPFSVAVWELGH
jgi:hypothetical protein